MCLDLDQAVQKKVRVRSTQPQEDQSVFLSDSRALVPAPSSRPQRGVLKFPGQAALLPSLGEASLQGRAGAQLCGRSSPAGPGPNTWQTP